MTLATNKTATQQSTMPELYAFLTGSTWSRYTSYTEDITFGGDIYKAAPIKRSGISYDTNFGNVVLNITAPLLDSLNAHIANQPIETVHVTVYRALYSDLTDWEVFFQGSVRYVTIENKVARATVEASSEILRSKVPTIIFQSECNWDLADNDCALEYDNLKIDVPIVSISSLEYEVSGISGYADDYFTGGVMTYGTDMRLITLSVQSTQILTLQVPFDTRVAVGTTVEILPGCDGSPDTCQTKFNNFTHFLGMPYIPTTNPVMWGFK